MVYQKERLEAGCRACGPLNTLWCAHYKLHFFTPVTGAQPYELSLAGVAKHIDMLERSGLVCKTRNGKEQIVTIAPKAFDEVLDYTSAWEDRLDSLGTYLQSLKK